METLRKYYLELPVRLSEELGAPGSGRFYIVTGNRLIDSIMYNDAVSIATCTKTGIFYWYKKAGRENDKRILNAEELKNFQFQILKSVVW